MKLNHNKSLLKQRISLLIILFLCFNLDAQTSTSYNKRERNTRTKNTSVQAQNASTTNYYNCYTKPSYRRRTNGNIQIDTISCSNTRTVVIGRYKNNLQVFNIRRNTIIYDNDTGNSYKIIQSEGIPLAPEKANMDRSDIVYFKLYFPPISPKTTSIDLLEYEEEDKGFNFYDIKLDGSQRTASFIDFESDTISEIISVIGEEPEFPGGIKVMMAFIDDNLNYPKYARSHNIQGTVKLSFIVEKDGSITEINEVSSPSPHLTWEAVRIVSIMPKWNPARQRGIPVRVKYFLPITFRLE